MYVPVRVGGPSGSPVRLIRPDIAWAIGSNNARPAIGPVWPNPDSDVTTSRGLRSRRRAGSRPIPASVPGRKFSTRTSDDPDEALEDGRRLRVAGVEGDPVLVAVVGHRVQALALVSGALVARVLTARPLDLDDLGTHVAQQLRTKRAGHEPAQVEDADPVKRSGVVSQDVAADAVPAVELEDDRRCLGPEGTGDQVVGVTAVWARSGEYRSPGAHRGRGTPGDVATWTRWTPVGRTAPAHRARSAGRSSP